MASDFPTGGVALDHADVASYRRLNQSNPLLSLSKDVLLVILELATEKDGARTLMRISRTWYDESSFFISIPIKYVADQAPSLIYSS